MTSTCTTVQTDLTRPASLQDHRSRLRARSRIWGPVAAVAVTLIALAVPAAAPAQVIPGALTVDTTRDSPNDGSCSNDCTLREAIALAGGGTGTPILLPAGVYKLTQGPLVITNTNTTVYGAGFFGNQSSGARTTVIDGNNASRVIQVPAEINAIFAGVTITGGRAPTGAGALIGDAGDLFLYNSQVRGNVATSRGGGVETAGALSLFQSLIAENSAPAGAGIAIDAPNGTIVAFASTVSDNTGPAVSTAGTFQFRNSTISGGLVGEAGASGGSSFTTNTILTGPGPACGGNLAALPRFSWTGNLASDTSCALTPAEGVQGVDPQIGALRNNRGPTDTRALQQGSPAINTGDPNNCAGVDQRNAASVGTCDKGAFEFGGQVPEAQLPPPVPGETVNASRARGTVRVKLPGSDDFFLLQDGQQLPMGTTFDTSKGRVNLVAAANNTGKTQKAWFYQGVFKVTQTKGRKPLTTLAMTGKLTCGGGKANVAAKKNRKRRLWGDGKGRFRTKGKHSAATVVGTKWLVEDRCNGTLTRVLRGTVRVRDFKRRKNITVRAGHKYFAKR
jgi:CSLREA domain-containing protein